MARLVGLLVATMVATSCSGSSSDLPPGWEGSEELSLAGWDCTTPVGSPPAIEIASRAEGLQVVLHRLAKRCNQDLCAFAREDDAATMVLIQPREMHPEAVTRCDCPAEVAFVLPSRESRGTLAIWYRNDSYGLAGPNEPRLIDLRSVPP
jgi:hypothetical protein